MDLPQFGFVEDLDEGERLLVAGGGVDHIDVFGTATDQRGDGHDLGTQLGSLLAGVDRHVAGTGDDKRILRISYG